MKKPLALLFLCLLTAPAALAQAAPPADRPSVILFIGDGMGTSQVTLGRNGAQQLGRPYQLDRFERVGLAGTRSANWVVTDSAAAATALASGVKTKNQTVGLDADGRTVQTILEAAHQAGYRTGLVTTTRITHATPACFVAHVNERDDEDPIAGQIVDCARKGYPQVLIGGGLRHFKDDRQAALREAGYALVTDFKALDAARGPKLAALLAGSHLPFSIERPEGFPSLAALTRKAVETLAEGGPFFLMVEGGRIDHACHQHDAPAALQEQLDLDQAVGWALDRTREDPRLLVVVTADHATGDLGISETVKLDGLLAVKASSEELTKKKLDPKDEPAVAAFVASVKQATGLELTPDELAFVWKKPDPYWARTILGHIVSARLGVHFYEPELQEREHTNTHGHDGAMVPVLAAGPGAERFQGLYENTEIPRRIAAVMGLELRGAGEGAGTGRRSFK